MTREELYQVSYAAAAKQSRVIRAKEEKLLCRLILAKLSYVEKEIRGKYYWINGRIYAVADLYYDICPAAAFNKSSKNNLAEITVEFLLVPDSVAVSDEKEPCVLCEEETGILEDYKKRIYDKLGDFYHNRMLMKDEDISELNRRMRSEKNFISLRKHWEWGFCFAEVIEPGFTKSGLNFRKLGITPVNIGADE